MIIGSTGLAVEIELVECGGVARFERMVNQDLI